MQWKMSETNRTFIHFSITFIFIMVRVAVDQKSNPRSLCVCISLCLGAVWMWTNPLLLLLCVYGLYTQAAGEHRAKLCTKSILLTLNTGSGTKHKKVVVTVGLAGLLPKIFEQLKSTVKLTKHSTSTFSPSPEDQQYTACLYAWTHSAYLLIRIWWLDSDLFSGEITALYCMSVAH